MQMRRKIDKQIDFFLIHITYQYHLQIFGHQWQSLLYASCHIGFWFTRHIFRYGCTSFDRSGFQEKTFIELQYADFSFSKPSANCIGFSSAAKDFSSVSTGKIYMNNFFLKHNSFSFHLFLKIIYIDLLITNPFIWLICNYTQIYIKI